MPATNKRLHVFLCHASQDKPVIRELYRRLCSEGWIEPWLDEEKILPGQDWNLEIEKGLETADAVIVCLSSQSVSKEGYIQKELRNVLDLALEKPEGTIFVIPLRLDACEMPRSLRGIQYVDYFPEHQRQSNYQKLLYSLEARAGRQTVAVTQLAVEIEFCPYCSNMLRKTEPIVRCKYCGTYYHKQCWANMIRCRAANCGSLECLDVGF